ERGHEEQRLAQHRLEHHTDRPHAKQGAEQDPRREQRFDYVAADVRSVAGPVSRVAPGGSTASGMAMGKPQEGHQQQTRGSKCQTESVEIHQYLYSTER